MEQSLSYQARRALLQQTVPQYREASPSHKKTLLDAFVAATGYHRTYARWLLNHAEEVQQTLQRPRPPQYGPEVQHALFLVWHAANRICAKRLIPFLPILIESLERHEHLQISEKCRRQLLAMSAATADRLLASQRKLGQRGLSTTRAGTLLKQQIPIRTFEEWKETRPGFLEADLVAHCGTDIEGGYLYTLTLSDVATGWTECLPLLYRSQETVLAALQQARLLFPFPILGIDTDSGGEFINEAVIAYCEQAHMTFTRGRPYLKNDQCFVEQKNGAIVRQVVGYDRLVGEHAYRQLTELYRALRLYVNCFQPSMKLLSKQRDGKKVRYVYDPAKTPLQRLFLSGVLPANKQQELTGVAQALDPIRLLRQLEQLQQAVFRCAIGCAPFVSSPLSDPLHVFSVAQCTAGSLPEVRNAPVPPAGLETLYREQERRKRILGWRRTHKDPFEGEWEQIFSWLQANPERSGGDIFRELQRRSPGRYQPLQIRTLQRGMRKIRTYLLESVEEQWQAEVIHGSSSPPVPSKENSARSPDH
ncbi:MAG TPA: transposase family protein [Ktedonobacteraceae bacterium]|nr:transposase family protein [Ktedonobacteraceae bacterium]